VTWRTKEEEMAKGTRNREELLLLQMGKSGRHL